MKKILAIAFTLGLVGCVDDGFEIPAGNDDIEEANDDTGPDTHKSDVDPARPDDGEDLPTLQDGLNELSSVTDINSAVNGNVGDVGVDTRGTVNTQARPARANPAVQGTLGTTTR